MNKNIVFLGFFTMLLAACNGGDGLGNTSQADTVVLDVRCAVDVDCPSGFECETEVEHGTESSYCVSHDSEGTSTGECPAGYELETEHAETFCKPHGGDDSGNGGSGGDDSGNGGGGDDSTGSGGDDSGSGGDDSTGGGGAAEGATCTTSADCASGLECETQIENGVTTSICKVHGSNG